MSENSPEIRNLPADTRIPGSVPIAQIEVERESLPEQIEWERGEEAGLGECWGAVIEVLGGDGVPTPYALQCFDHTPGWMVMYGDPSQIERFHSSRAALGISEAAVYDHLGASMNATC